MIRLPSVERGMKQTLIVEIAVATIDRQPRRGNRHEECSGASLDHLVVRAGRDHDHFVAKARRGTQLRFHIGPDASARGRIKGANVNDTHRGDEAVRAGELQVKLCS